MSCVTTDYGMMVAMSQCEDSSNNNDGDDEIGSTQTSNDSDIDNDAN